MQLDFQNDFLAAAIIILFAIQGSAVAWPWVGGTKRRVGGAKRREGGAKR